ncbi:MAG: hypothetical protein F6K39_16945 [Okeania sp. SIO3B3]|nr:hypothetical protein [Okeania sp. SIO3B3]
MGKIKATFELEKEVLTANSGLPKNRLKTYTNSEDTHSSFSPYNHSLPDFYSSDRSIVFRS